MRINQRVREASLKMTSKAGIIAFTVFGVAGFLLTFLGLAFTSLKPMATWKILVGGVGGTIFVGVVIVAALRFGRYLITKLFKENANTTIQ
ncbi:MAG: hypothetical protein P8075_07835 [Deltaproteobacteria bacterium]|jgi:hypothetical protein